MEKRPCLDYAPSRQSNRSTGASLLGIAPRTTVLKISSHPIMAYDGSLRLLGPSAKMVRSISVSLHGALTVMALTLALSIILRKVMLSMPSVTRTETVTS